MSEPDVLIVDEPSPAREQIRSRLTAAGMEVECVDSGAAARDHLATRSVDCVVTEYQTPNIDGLHLTKELAADGIPVVLFTNDGDETVASEAIAAGANDYVPRSCAEPVDRLVAGIERVVSRGRSGPPHATEVIERMTAGFFALDTDWRFTYCNDAIVDLLGKPRESLLGESIWEAIPEAVGSEFDRRYREAMDSQESVTFETYVPAVENLEGVGERWYEVHAYPSQDGLSVYFLDVTETRRTEKRYRSLFESWPDAVALFDPQGQYVIVNQAMADSLGLPREELEGTYLHDHFSEELANRRLEGGLAAIEQDQRVIDEDGRDGRYFHNIYVPVDEETYQVISRDITERRKRERELERQRDELETLDRINAVIRDINHELIQADCREDIERVVCERLADSEPYLFAWVGEPNVATEKIDPRTGAGQGGGYLDEVTVRFDYSPTGRGPGGRAIRTGQTQVMQDIDTFSEPWKSLARERGFHSIAAIPLGYGNSLYGVLCVYAGRPHAFDDRETAVLSELGQTMAYAINAVESKRALVAEPTTELILSNRDSGSFFIDASRRFDCQITLEGATESADGELVEFCTVAGCDSDCILELAEADDNIDRARLVSEGAEADRFEFVYTGQSVLTTLADYGAKVRSLVADCGEARIVAELPHDVNVRRVVESFETAYPESELLAQREAGGSADHEQNLRDRIDKGLTDRQRASLEAAHFGGFFEWPRGSTGEQLAASLGISAPTFHQHLRAAKRKMASAYLDRQDW